MMDRNYNQFANCGVHQVRHSNGDIEWDQDEYLDALIPIKHPRLTGAKAEDDPDEELIGLFWSLLVALAYALTTQHWLAGYIVALQRMTRKPKIIHIRRLNAYVRLAQAQHAHIVYTAMKCLRTVDTHSDAGFSKLKP